MLKNNAGFTLIEMMLVVAIIGVLSAIAVPVYNRYMSKARQGEAKVSLAAIYVAEKAFHSDYGAYVSSFAAMSYEPEGLKRFYTVGWAADMSGSVTGYTGTLARSAYDRVGAPANFGCDATAARAVLPATITTADSQVFTAGAAGEVTLGLGCDIWTIDHQKNLLNTVPNL